MIWLILSIICSSLITVVFKALPRYKIDNHNAISFNYLTCFLTGLLTMETVIVPSTVLESNWILPAVLLGVLFISAFRLIGKGSQILGVTIVTMALRLSLIIPVSAAFIIYSDSPDTYKIFGLLIALPSLLLSTRIFERKESALHGSIWLALVIFLISGTIDTSLKYIQEFIIQESEAAIFSTVLFGTAGAIGFLIMPKFSSRMPNYKDIIGGICLGLPNYGSIFFLLKALAVPNLQSSVVFPLNNIGIVVVSAIAARLLYREEITRLQGIGILLAIISIILLSFSSL